MNIEEFPYSESKLPQDGNERMQVFAQLKEEIQTDLRTNERYKSFFEEYDPRSWDSFITSYASHKVDLARSCQYYHTKMESAKEVKHRWSTEEILSLINQKKLFNLQLLWRAEQISLPRIRTSHDFRMWGKHIERCPFIEPITEAEIAVMKTFLMDDNFCDTTVSWFGDWQDYAEIMEKNEMGDRDLMPEWYQYYDSRLGTGSLLLLPNIRGEKEKYYTDKGRNKFWEERREAQIQHEATFKHSLWADKKTYKKFMSLFEDDPYFHYLQKGMDLIYAPKNGVPEEEQGELQWAMRVLEDVEFEPPRSRGGLPWYEEVIRTARLYQNICISNKLDAVYQEKLMLQELGIGDYMNEEEFEEACSQSVVRMENDFILDGRELCGEPRDFNFYGE